LTFELFLVDYLMNLPHKFQVGQVVTAKAWWTIPEGQLVKCKVEKQCIGNLPKVFYEVRPIDNPGAHGRFVNEGILS